MRNEETAYHEAARLVKDAAESKLFGKPCYKVNGKAFCCFFQNAMVFKLSGDNHTKAMALDGAQLFDPSGKGRPMKEWVQIPFDYQELWGELSHSAAEYICSGK